MLPGLLNNAEELIRQNPPLAFLAVFLAGVTVSFTPCVYPVIPMTLGYIGARGAGARWKGFFLSLVYVLGMALTYAVLGMIAALSGRLFGRIATHPAVYFLVGNVCLLLGLSMLGVFELRMPFVPKTPSRRGGWFGAFLIGIFAGLIVGPCTAPVLAAVLVYVGSSGDPLYGFWLLFAFGYGVGFLIILLGTFSGLLTSMPRSGPWLERVRKGFGWALVLAAEYLFVKMGGFLI